MDAYKVQVQGSLQGAGICAQLCAGLCGLASCAVAITFTVYLGIFAMNNPNGEGVYGVVGGQEFMKTQQQWDAMPVTAVVHDLDDVHDHFVTWFMWGFINACGTLGAMMLICIPCCPPVLGCFQCSSLAWFIAGMVWRLRRSGAFASGDIMPANTTEEDWIAQIKDDDAMQYESGQFMWIYYMIMWIMMGVSCCCGCLGAIVGACAK